MNLTPSWISKLERGDSVQNMLLAAFLVYWLCLLPALFGHAAAASAGSRVLTLPALAAMYWIASVRSAQLARALAVLGQLQAPHALLRSLVREKLMQLTLAWAFLATGLTLELALPASQVPALSGAALVSLAACLGVLRSLSSARLLAIPLRTLLDAAPYLAGVALVLLGANMLLDGFGRLPLPLLSLCALTFPYLALRLAKRWQHALPRYRWTEQRPTHGIVAWIKLQARRSTVLTWGNRLYGRDGMIVATSPSFMKMSPLAFPFFMLSRRPLWEDGRVGLFGSMMLVMVGLTITGGLIARDLHWRSLLMPGGLRRGRIASDILVSTLACQYAVSLVLAAAYAVCAHVLLSMSWDTIGHQLLRASTLPLEILFATSLALLVRTAPAFPWFFGAAFVLVLSVPFIAIKRHYWSIGDHLAVSLPVFVLVMLAASALMVALANRLWTSSILFKAARLEQQRR